MATIAQRRQPPHILWYGLAFLIAITALAAIVIAVAFVANTQRWNGQKVEAASTLAYFCQYNLPVSETECRNWAYQTVNAAPSTTDSILLCNDVFWNGASRRDQEAFVWCLARSGVYIPD